MPYRILHLSDLHLETSFAAAGLPPAIGARRRADLRTTLERIVALATERQVQAITIAGDLYDQMYAMPDAGSYLVQQFTKLAPIKVVIAPGESDPFSSDSLYGLTLWPDNVTIMPRGRLANYEIEPGIVLWGAAFPPLRGHNVFEHLHLESNQVNLLLIHAIDQSQSDGKQEGHFVIDLASVRTMGFDLALLGDRHDTHAWPVDAPQAIYPGSPEPLTLEDGQEHHSVVLVTIENKTCTTEVIPISSWRNVSVQVNLIGCANLVEAAQRTQSALQEKQCVDDERVICEVNLTGLPEFDLDVDALAGEIVTKATVLYRSHLALPYDLDRLSQEQTARGLLVKRFRTRLDGAATLEEQRLVLNALNLALRALDGKEVRLSEIG